MTFRSSDLDHPSRRRLPKDYSEFAGGPGRNEVAPDGTRRALTVKEQAADLRREGLSDGQPVNRRATT